jgi:hypothetical protein
MYHPSELYDISTDTNPCIAKRTPVKTKPKTDPITPLLAA